MLKRAHSVVGATSPILELRDRVGAEWPFITAARERTDALLERLSSELRLLCPRETTLVVFGSLGRREFTSDSDIDWTLLVDGSADPDHQLCAQRIGGRLREKELPAPAPGGPFGSLTFSHDLIHRIGGDHDTNRNTHTAAGPPAGIHPRRGPDGV